MSVAEPDLASEQGCPQFNPPGIGVIRFINCTPAKDTEGTIDATKPTKFQLDVSSSSRRHGGAHGFVLVCLEAMRGAIRFFFFFQKRCII